MQLPKGGRRPRKATKSVQKISIAPQKAGFRTFLSLAKKAAAGVQKGAGCRARGCRVEYRLDRITIGFDGGLV